MNIAVVCKELNPQVLSYLKDQFKNDKINIVSPCFEKLREYNNIREIPDNLILDRNELESKINIDRFSWYYQQFLKYKLVLYFDDEETLIIDGDTILKREVIEADTLLSQQRRIIPPFVNFNLKLVEDLYKNRKPVSFVTNQMVFRKKYIKEIIELIEYKTNLNWIEGIALILSQNRGQTMFSEYQLYADYVVFKSSPIVKNIKVFRRFDLINSRFLNAALNKYQIIAFEHNHRSGLLSKMRAYLYFICGINFG